MSSPGKQLTEARDDLHQIVTLAAHLLDQAIHGQHNGRLDAAAEIPGGDAMIMLGPAANYEAWAHQVTTRIRLTGTSNKLEQTWLERFDGWVTDDHHADPETPIFVLTAWEDMWRQHLDLLTPITRRPTIERAARFLLDHLARMSTVNRPSFDDFTRDVASLRLRLEAILTDGDRDEKGAPCLHCKGILLRRIHPKDGRQDWWDCPRCHRTYSYAEYWNAVKAQYRANAPALTADDIETQLHVPKTILRVWAHRGLVDRMGRNEAGRTLYRVADVRRAAGIEAA